MATEIDTGTNALFFRSEELRLTHNATAKMETIPGFIAGYDCAGSQILSASKPVLLNVGDHSKLSDHLSVE
jgi:hypothetical protein